MNKNYLFPHKPRSLFAYLLPLLLSIWGISNVLYWEMYKGYSACDFCKWHRGAYVALFMFLLILFKFRNCFFKLLIWFALTIEMIVSLLQVFGFCKPLVCRYISFNEKLNLSFAVGTFMLLLICELRSYLNNPNRKYKK